VAVLHDPADRSNLLILNELQEAAPTLRLTVQPIGTRAAGDFEGAFVEMTRERADGMFGAPDVLTFEHRQTILDLAAKHRMPQCGATGTLSVSAA